MFSHKCRWAVHGNYKPNVAVFLVLHLTLLPALSLADSIPRPVPSDLVLGVTQKNALVERYGETSARENIYLDGGTQDANNVTTLVYSPGLFSSFFLGGVRPGVNPYKVLMFQFNNDLLMKYRFISNYVKDSTDFDEQKVALIEKGVSTPAQVKSLLGEPSGMAIYPSARFKGDIRFIYEYLEHDTNERTILTKRLHIDFDERSVVRDYDLAVNRATNVSSERGVLDFYFYIPMPKHR